MSDIWTPPDEAPSIPWARIEQSLVAAHRGPNPHKLSLRIPEAERRAPVAMVLWGDAAGARKIVLLQRGFTAPQHPGEDGTVENPTSTWPDGDFPRPSVVAIWHTRGKKVGSA